MIDFTLTLDIEWDHLWPFLRTNVTTVRRVHARSLSLSSKGTNVQRFSHWTQAQADTSIARLGCRSVPSCDLLSPSFSRYVSNGINFRYHINMSNSIIYRITFSFSVCCGIYRARDSLHLGSEGFVQLDDGSWKKKRVVHSDGQFGHRHRLRLQDWMKIAALLIGASVAVSFSSGLMLFSFGFCLLLLFMGIHYAVHQRRAHLSLPIRLVILKFKFYCWRLQGSEYT